MCIRDRVSTQSTWGTAMFLDRLRLIDKENDYAPPYLLSVSLPRGLLLAVQPGETVEVFKLNDVRTYIKRFREGIDKGEYHRAIEGINSITSGRPLGLETLSCVAVWPHPVPRELLSHLSTKSAALEPVPIAIKSSSTARKVLLTKSNKKSVPLNPEKTELVFFCELSGAVKAFLLNLDEGGWTPLGKVENPTGCPVIDAVVDGGKLCLRTHGEQVVICDIDLLDTSENYFQTSAILSASSLYLHDGLEGIGSVLLRPGFKSLEAMLAAPNAVSLSMGKQTVKVNPFDVEVLKSPEKEERPKKDRKVEDDELSGTSSDEEIEESRSAASGILIDLEDELRETRPAVRFCTLGVVLQSVSSAKGEQLLIHDQKLGTRITVELPDGPLVSFTASPFEYVRPNKNLSRSEALKLIQHQAITGKSQRLLVLFTENSAYTLLLHRPRKSISISPLMRLIRLRPFVSRAHWLDPFHLVLQAETAKHYFVALPPNVVGHAFSGDQRLIRC
eukprot:TRINITY_DN5542_c0_g1_i2.p1 TRINITY_DN5542_c0_g1~~TRINITY_DN5542_c0_g1_i2.p1  ORF type:complete len:523 (+),score=115.05 TRINITY_DN5542_c0_g1_i2:63-1571(+)